MPMLLHQSLANGVRLRLARPADADGVRTLAERADASVDARALVASDPHERAVICAVTVDPDGERVVAVGSIRLRENADPDLLLAEDDEVREALREALVARHGARPRPKSPRPARALRAVARQGRRPA